MALDQVEGSADLFIDHPIGEKYNMSTLTEGSGDQITGALPVNCWYL